LTTNKLKEIQKEVDLRAMEAVFQETKDVLIGSNYFDVKVNLGYLEDFLVKYGEDTLA
jgi:hypothetical protein